MVSHDLGPRLQADADGFRWGWLKQWAGHAELKPAASHGEWRATMMVR